MCSEPSDTEEARQVRAVASTWGELGRQDLTIVSREAETEMGIGAIRVPVGEICIVRGIRRVVRRDRVGVSILGV